MIFLLHILRGIAIGIGGIVPGISSGVLCVIMGIYEELIHIVTNFFTDIKKNIIYLAPLFIGAIIGVFLFSNVIILMLENYELQSKALFTGLIIRKHSGDDKRCTKKRTLTQKSEACI